MKSAIAEVTVALMAQTQKAIMVTEDGAKMHWLPSHLIEINELNKTTEVEGRARPLIEVSAPEWLLQKEGLI